MKTSRHHGSAEIAVSLKLVLGAVVVVILALLAAALAIRTAVTRLGDVEAFEVLDQSVTVPPIRDAATGAATAGSRYDDADGGRRSDPPEPGADETPAPPKAEDR